jgi:phage baseplate assembly protein W
MAKIKNSNILYRGFSTHNRLKKFRVTDFDLVQQDLFNAFNIKKGEKLMNPNFGTIIWSMLFEPFTEQVRDAITNDVKRVTSYDPRLAVNTIQINEFLQGIQIVLNVTYIPNDQTATLTLNFDRDSKTAGRGTVPGASSAY